MNEKHGHRADKPVVLDVDFFGNLVWTDRMRDGGIRGVFRDVRVGYCVLAGGVAVLRPVRLGNGRSGAVLLAGIGFP